MFTKKLLGALALVLASSSALAHEFWIEPASHRPEANSLLTARLMIGHADDKEAYARNPKHLAEFTLLGANSSHDLVGRPGADPAGSVRLPGNGNFVLNYRSNTSFLEMKAGKFEAYLIEEGLEHVVAERKRLGESGKAGRESYSRCAKALLRTPGSSSAGFDRSLGLPLELVPVSDPFAFQAGEKNSALPFLLLSNEKPLVGAKVHAQSLDHPTVSEISGRTDEKGIVRLALPVGGRWVVSAVEMSRAEGAANHDWRSYWASLSFEVGSVPAREDSSPARKIEKR